jgi:hypothetical protein
VTTAADGAHDHAIEPTEEHCDDENRTEALVRIGPEAQQVIGDIPRSAWPRVPDDSREI